MLKISLAILLSSWTFIGTIEVLNLIKLNNLKLPRDTSDKQILCQNLICFILFLDN